MAGKVCLVTGGTSGIGRVTATALAQHGADLIITGRHPRRAEEAVSAIRSETGNLAVRYLLADFSDLAQVRELARACKENYSRLDVLVNNAGTFSNTRRETAYGVERTFLVNHLAPFLLTDLLLEVLLASAPARIVNVSSDGHRQGTIDFDDLGFKRGYFGMKAYARSKLANVMFTYELARRLDATQITANTLHPGHVATDMWKTPFPVIGPALKWVMGRLALSPEEGAGNTIYLASSPEVAGITGKYFVKREPAPSSPLSYDEPVARRLWETCAKLTAPDYLAGKSGV
jgi:NAD(P)-dependent dehydrogenase (short-subunit alcohol dehydrogenase family)